MKNLVFHFLFCTLLSHTGAYARAKLITASGGSPIPTTYSSSDPQSKVLTCPASKEVEVLNDTSEKLALGFKGEDAIPSEDYSIIISGPDAVRVYRQDPQNVVIGNGTVVYIRSLGAPIITGEVAVSCF